MNKDEAELQKFISNFREEFVNLPFEQIAFPRGVKGMGKYKEKNSFNYIKGTPIHVKGALIFNKLLQSKNIKNIPPIQDGDKIKFAYLKEPNPIGETVIATPDEMPTEFNLDKYVDRELQFTKSFLEPLRSIAEVINWQVEQRSTLEEFFG